MDYVRDGNNSRGAGNNFQKLKKMKHIKYLLFLLIFLSCKKDQPQDGVKTCYECKLVVQGIYIADIDTCLVGNITAPQLICKEKK